jgi:bis(5'-nucleosidyl)-tetraphosphatase
MKEEEHFRPSVSLIFSIRQSNLSFSEEEGRLVRQQEIRQLLQWDPGYNMIEELSAGAVLYREDAKRGQRRFLILHYPAGHWDFPKGAVERGETEEEAAKREIREETGIEVSSFVPNFRKKIEYHYRRSGGLSHKQVVFFLAKADREDVKISHEHSGYEWLDYNRTLSRLTFENARNVLREANSFLSASPRSSRVGST